MAKYKQKEKQAYLEYYRGRGPSKNTLTFGQWRKRKKQVSRGGGSPQVRRQRMGLSRGDYEEVRKFFRN